MGPWEITLTPLVRSSRQAHSTERAPMTLHNHLLTNTIPLPPHHPLLFLNSAKNLSQNRTHFPQNLSRANPSLPPEHIPNNSPGPEKNLSQNRTHFPQNLSHSA